MDETNKVQGFPAAERDLIDDEHSTTGDGHPDRRGSTTGDGHGPQKGSTTGDGHPARRGPNRGSTTGDGHPPRPGEKKDQPVLEKVLDKLTGEDHSNNRPR